MLNKQLLIAVCCTLISLCATEVQAAAALRRFPLPVLVAASVLGVDAAIKVCYATRPREVTLAPSLYAAVRDNDKHGVSELLAQPDSDVNERNKDGRTPLHLAVLNGRAQFVDALLADQRTDVNAITADGKTALDMAESIQGQFLDFCGGMPVKHIDRIVDALRKAGGKTAVELNTELIPERA